jgi:hypothetical protein
VQLMQYVKLKQDSPHYPPFWLASHSPHYPTFWLASHSPQFSRFSCITMINFMNHTLVTGLPCMLGETLIHSAKTHEPWHELGTTHNWIFADLGHAMRHEGAKTVRFSKSVAGASSKGGRSTLGGRSVTSLHRHWSFNMPNIATCDVVRCHLWVVVMYS